jgi:hypothetical protein
VLTVASAMQYLAIGMAFTNENPELFEEGFS